MASTGLPPNAHATLDLRYPQPLLSHILIVQPTHISSSRTVRAGTIVSAEALTPVVLRYEKYQDALPVNSIEGEDDQPMQGLRHYLHMHHQKGLTIKASLDHTDYTALSHFNSPTLTMAPPPLHPHPRAPSPPNPPTSYGAPIYSGKTHNPAVFLAILHIAQHNLPHLDLVSALNHIPHLSPTDTLPALLPAAPGNLAVQPFLDTRSARPKREGEEETHVAFLPHFYDSGARHALGFFQVGQCASRGRVLGNAFFTPCTEEELRQYGLVSYVESADGEGEEGVETMSRVGCEEGEWVERDTVEEYEEWKLAFRVASVVWEARMGLVRGKTEG